MYLTKPVTVDLLVSALHALLRRSWGATGERRPRDATLASRHDGWYVTGSDGELIAFTAIERALLQRLRDAAGAPVDKETLIAAIADDPIDFDPHRLEVVIHRLRRKLTSAAGAGMEIVTVRGAGYSLVTVATP